MVFWFCGLPGVGKDYCADRFVKLFPMPKLNGDDFLTDSDKDKLVEGTFTTEDRLRKLKRIMSKAKKLLAANQHLAICDSLSDSLARKFVTSNLGKNVAFILVVAQKKVHLERMRLRKEHFFGEAQLDDWVKKHWQKMQMPHLSLRNDDDETNLKKQLIEIYKNYT